jgi:hypothetical protein
VSSSISSGCPKLRQTAAFIFDFPEQFNPVLY